MVQITVEVSGMVCGMCEAHVNDAVRAAFPVQKVVSSHAKGQTVLWAEAPIDEARLKSVIDATGYTAGTVTSVPCEKRGLFAALKRRRQ